MKISILSPRRTLWLLVIFISLTEVKPQGYSYPVPSKPDITSTSTSSITEAAAGSLKETTTAFSGYIIEGKENSSALAEGIDVTTTSPSEESETSKDETLTTEQSEASSSNPGDDDTENNTTEITDKGDSDDKIEDKEDQDVPATTVETSEKEEKSEDIQESTTPSEDSETTTLLSGPYPPSGSRPTGREFSYDVRHLFPGMKQAESTALPVESPTNKQTPPEPRLEPRIGPPLQQEYMFSMNRLTNEAQNALVSPGPQHSYFYQTPQQQMRYTSYQQRPPITRNFQPQRFVMSFPTRTYSAPAPYPAAAPYPASKSSYDQRFSSSDTVAQSLFFPRGNEYHEQPQYEFHYDVRAPPYGPFFGHEERRVGDAASGKYYVVQPDGRMRVVSYEAGPQGFRPSTSYEAAIDYQDYP